MNFKDFCTVINNNHCYYFLSSAGACGSSSEPTISDLANKVVTRISTKWKQVAIELGVSWDEINRISKDENGSFDQFMTVLHHWKSASMKPYTWKTVIAALKSECVNELSLAEELRCKFCS